MIMMQFCLDLLYIVSESNTIRSSKGEHNVHRYKPLLKNI